MAKELTSYETCAIYHLTKKEIIKIQSRGSLLSLKFFKRELNNGKSIKYFITFTYFNYQNDETYNYVSGYIPPFEVFKNLYEKQSETGYEFTDKLLRESIIKEDYY